MLRGFSVQTAHMKLWSYCCDMSLLLGSDRVCVCVCSFPYYIYGIFLFRVSECSLWCAGAFCSAGQQGNFGVRMKHNMQEKVYKIIRAQGRCTDRRRRPSLHRRRRRTTHICPFPRSPITARYITEICGSHIFRCALCAHDCAVCFLNYMYFKSKLIFWLFN